MMYFDGLNSCFIKGPWLPGQNKYAPITLAQCNSINGIINRDMCRYSPFYP
jgi:hypothetical protein